MKDVIWKPPEILLDRYWKELQDGEYHIFQIKDRHDECSRPKCEVNLWTEADMTRTLGLWSQYVGLIEEKTAIGTPNLDHNADVGLIEETILQQYNITGFTKHFLLHARRPHPSIEFIAPGLHPLTAADLTSGIGNHLNQRWLCFEEFEFTKYIWLPLFFSTQSIPRFEQYASLDHYPPWETLDMLQQGKTTNIETYMHKYQVYHGHPGLYIQISNDPQTRFGDEVIMVSPEELGMHTWYPNTKFQEWRHRTLFKYAREGCPYHPDHGLRLSSVLSKWIQLLEDGVFTMGADGVQGGIKTWLSTGEDDDRFVLEEDCYRL